MALQIPESRSVRYRHRQVGYLMIVVFGVIALDLLTVLLFIYFLAELNIAWLFVAPLVPLVLLALFWSLTVTVTDIEVDAAFGIGLIRFRIPLADIASAAPVRNHLYQGWGIRILPKGGRLYNVSGYDAVELRLHDGRVRRIGTDQPQQLTDAIAQALSRR